MSGIIWLQVVSWVGRTALLQAPKVGRPFKKGNSQHQSSSKWLHFPFLMFNLVSYDCDIPRSIFKRILCTHHHWWPFLPLSAHGGCVANFGICGCLCSAGTSESTRGRGGGEKSLPSCHGWLWWLLSRAGKTLENSHGTQEWRFVQITSLNVFSIWILQGFGSDDVSFFNCPGDLQSWGVMCHKA